MRGGAIVAVVGLHVTFGFLAAAPLGTRAGAVALALHLATTFGVPLFLVLSMIGLVTRDPRPLPVGRPWLRFLAERARRLLPAYVVWSAVTVLRDSPAALVRPRALASVLLTGSADEQLYFVPLIFELYVAWPVLSRLAHAARRSPSRALVVAAAGVGVSLAWWSLSARALVPNDVLTLPLFWIAWAGVGVAVAPYVRRLLRFAPARGAALVAAAAAATLLAGAAMLAQVNARMLPGSSLADVTATATIFQVPVLLYTLAVIALWFVAAARARPTDAAEERPERAALLARALIGLGHRSYGIYLVHVLVLEAVVERVFGRPSPGDFTGTAAWPAKLVATWLACVALSDALVRLVARVDRLRVIVGVPPLPFAVSSSSVHAHLEPSALRTADRIELDAAIR